MHISVNKKIIIIPILVIVVIGLVSFSSDETEELRAIHNTDKRIIPQILAESSNRVFIKQRYIWRLNNNRILAQASKKFFENKKF